MKSPATPVLVMVLFLYITIRAIVDLVIFLAPHILQLSQVLYSGAKDYLYALLTIGTDYWERVGYSLKPLPSEGIVDYLLMSMIADIALAVACVYRLGARICE